MKLKKELYPTKRMWRKLKLKRIRKEYLKVQSKETG